MMSSLLYEGKVRHRRFTDKPHEFTYKLFMFCFDVNSINDSFRDLSQVSIEKFNWFTFKRKNYLKNAEIPLDVVARDMVKEKYGIYPTGKIYLLTHLSCLNYCFNPISLYFVFQKNTEVIEYLIVEVTNTPWGERHWYILSNPLQSRNQIYKYKFHKQLHVSPFLAMDYEYNFNLKLSAEQIILHMENYKQGDKHFDATLSLSSVAPTKISARKTFIRHPLMTYKVSAAIYWQAFKLWFKGNSFHSHP